MPPYRLLWQGWFSPFWLVPALGLLTAWILLDPRVGFSYRGPEARLIIESAVAFIGLSVIFLSVSRFLESGLVIDAGIALAFLALVIPNIGQGMIMPASGVDLFNWQDAGMYVWSISRFVAFLVLLTFGVYRGREVFSPGRRWQVLAVGGACVLAFGAADYTVFYVLHSEIPDLLTDTGRAMLASGSSTKGAFSDVTGLQVTLQLTLTALAALVCLLFLGRRSSDGSQGRFHYWVGVSLIFAAFSQLHYAIYPSIYSPAITTGDALRLAFYASLMVGIVTEQQRYQRLSRQLSALEERTRIARDVHDGAAQGLSFAIGSLADTLHQGVAPALAQRLSRLREVLCEAQDNLRDAIAALGPSSHGQDLREMVALFCQDFSRRYEMEIDLECTGQPGVVPPPKDRELLFLLAEMLHNVRKHGPTAHATVALETTGQHLLLRVSDGGVGVAPTVQKAQPVAASTHYGFTVMTERAARLDGTLQISSDAQEGTTVQLTIPR